MEKIKPRTDYELKMDILVDKIRSVTGDFLLNASKINMHKTNMENIRFKMEELCNDMLGSFEYGDWKIG